MMIFNFIVIFFSKRNITVIKIARSIKNEIILTHIDKKLYILSPVLLMHSMQIPKPPMLVILNGIDDNLRGYDLAGKLDISLGSTNDSASLVLIIILFLGRHVK